MTVDVSKLTAYAVLEGPDGTDRLRVTKLTAYAVLRESPPRLAVTKITVYAVLREQPPKPKATMVRMSLRLGLGL